LCSPLAIRCASGTLPRARRTTYGKQLSPLHYSRSKRNGFSAVAANVQKSLVAACEYGLNPEVLIFKYPGKDPVHKFKADTTIQCSSMTFSRDGRYLLMIGAVPDYTLSLLDLEAGKKLACTEKIPCHKNFKRAKFNPVNSREFAILASDCCYFYKIHPAYEVTQQKGQNFLGESDRLQKTEFRSENPEVTFGYFVWDGYGRVHICADLPQLIQVDSHTAAEECCLALQARPLTCTITQKHMIIALDDGAI